MSKELIVDELVSLTTNQIINKLVADKNYITDKTRTNTITVGIPSNFYEMLYRELTEPNRVYRYTEQDLCDGWSVIYPIRDKFNNVVKYQPLVFVAYEGQENCWELEIPQYWDIDEHGH